MKRVMILMCAILGISTSAVLAEDNNQFKVDDKQEQIANVEEATLVTEAANDVAKADENSAVGCKKMSVKDYILYALLGFCAIAFLFATYNRVKKPVVLYDTIVERATKDIANGAAEVNVCRLDSMPLELQRRSEVKLSPVKKFLYGYTPNCTIVTIACDDRGDVLSINTFRGVVLEEKLQILLRDNKVLKITK